MPENVKLLILECRGLPVKMLQDIVHHHGGILGPAHPCGERHLSITRTRLYKKHPEIMENFDFLEGLIPVSRQNPTLLLSALQLHIIYQCLVEAIPTIQTV